MKRRPTALFVTPRFLFPANEGGKICATNILRDLKDSFDVTLASPAPREAGAFAADVEKICHRFASWPAPDRSLFRRMKALTGPLPYSVATDYCAAGRALIERELANAPDILLVDFVQTTVLLPARVPLPSVLFAHNVEAEILERHAALNAGLRRAVWTGQGRKMRRFEGSAMHRFDCTLTVSKRDRDHLRSDYGLADVRSIGTGVDLEYYRFSPPELVAEPPPTGGTVVFSGAIGSAANSDAVRFLIDEIWPRVARVRPDARALIVGRDPPSALIAHAHKSGPWFTFTGSVEDVRPFITEAHVSIMPIRAGSGIRIKTFEAMALGRPIVATTVGIEGLEVTPGEHYLLADDPDDFAAAILRLLDDGGLRAGLARAARALLEERFSWHVVAGQAQNVCRELLERAGGNRERAAVTG